MKNKMIKLIDEAFLDKISGEAKSNPRLRMNYNLHDSLDAKAQRLLNAMQPGTVLPVHRHVHTAETYFLLRGRIEVLFYNDRKELSETFEISSEAKQYGIHIPAGEWHTVNVLEPDTVIFEVKDGPYTPLSEENVMKMKNGKRRMEKE